MLEWRNTRVEEVADLILDTLYQADRYRRQGGVLSYARAGSVVTGRRQLGIEAQDFLRRRDLERVKPTESLFRGVGRLIVRWAQPNNIFTTRASFVAVRLATDVLEAEGCRLRFGKKLDKWYAAADRVDPTYKTAVSVYEALINDYWKENGAPNLSGFETADRWSRNQPQLVPFRRRLRTLRRL